MLFNLLVLISSSPMFADPRISGNVRVFSYCSAEISSSVSERRVLTE